MEPLGSSGPSGQSFGQEMSELQVESKETASATVGITSLSFSVCEFLLLITIDCVAMANDSKVYKKRMKILDQETYDLVLSYKLSTKSIADLVLRKKIKNIATTFDLVNGSSDEPWPKGKTLHKVQFDKKGQRIGTILICNYYGHSLFIHQFLLLITILFILYCFLFQPVRQKALCSTVECPLDH